MKETTDFLLKTESGRTVLLQVIHIGNKGIDWDYPVKPNETVKGLSEILSQFEWEEKE